MSKLEKQSFKTALYFIVTFYFLSELWDVLIYLIFPDRPSEITNLAVAIIHPDRIEDILLGVLISAFFVFGFSLAFAWLLRKLGGDKAFFERQKPWLWILAGAIFSLTEFRDVVGRFWSNALILFLLGGLGYIYVKFKE